ncbi:MAG: hypothetical protein ACYSX0_18210, partial [Planctomycetota bacterium]
CGWIDEDGDGVNDRFRDADGDGTNDYDHGPYSGFVYRHGFHQAHLDADGNGMDDVTGEPYCMGFGWVYADGDGKNDAFTDDGGDGVNDHTGRHYDEGYADHTGHDDGGQGGADGHMGPPASWPGPMPGSGMGAMG